MKTMTRTNKAVVLTIVVAMLFVATLLALTACNDPTEPVDPVTTKYDATLTANVTMGGAGTYNMGVVLKDTFVTDDNGKYTLTLIFQAPELQVMGITGRAFVDDAPSDPKTVGGITDGTIGVYNNAGTLVTEDVKLTYSSGDEYMLNVAKESVYYVQSAAFPIESLKDSYSLALYVNSAMSGKQYSKDVAPATLAIDLTSGQEVEEISGLGVDTKGEAPAQPTVYSYDAQLSMFVNAMGGMEFGGVLDSVYVSRAYGEYTVTIIFKEASVNVRGNDYATCITDVDGEIGYYDGDDLVTEDIELTYSTGYDYVSASLGSYPNQRTENIYYVKSMTFTTATLEETYDLALFLGSAAMSAQFAKDGSYNAILTIDLDSKEQADAIVGKGASVCGVVPEEESAYLQYDAQLSCLVSAMGFEFGEGLLDGAYVSQEDGQSYITLIFKANTMNVMGQSATAFIDDSANGAVIGIYKADGTLVTDGVELTYSDGEDFVADKSGNKLYYVKSAKFAVDSLQDEIRLALYVNSNKMGYQFSESEKYPAILTIDLSEATCVDSISDLLGVAARGEVEAE